MNTTSDNNLELQLAWQIIEQTDTNLFLTGKAGTGKTTFLRKLKENSPKRMIVLAPTGIAAINARGVTIILFSNFLWLHTCLILHLTVNNSTISYANKR